MTQLRKDIRGTFSGAQERVIAHPPGDAGLAVALMRWLDGATRFIAPHPAVTAARRGVHERADAVVEIETNTGGIVNRVARRHLLAALAEMEAAIDAHGRANADADRVGIATEGSPVREPAAARPAGSGES
ncbi:hypothetical protein [Methylobacterium sp. Leaf466]|uniref:hypothetical protein n=1 Tax=Methylobacterium sp. Leaf466 TaxID=1736386 RepID=UPI000B0D5E7F|nr:hypothetical protein [Methylobacterium sp. Leaf466]